MSISGWMSISGGFDASLEMATKIAHRRGNLRILHVEIANLGLKLPALHQVLRGVSRFGLSWEVAPGDQNGTARPGNRDSRRCSRRLHTHGAPRGFAV